jgi:hypothetical protein
MFLLNIFLCHKLLVVDNSYSNAKRHCSIILLVKYIDVFMIAFDIYRICNEFQVDAIDIQYVLIKIKKKEEEEEEKSLFVYLR